MPATLQSPGEQQPLDNTMGAMLIGILVSAVLYGMSLVQTYFYYNHYRNDVWYLKTLVALTVFFDTLHLCFVIHTSKILFASRSLSPLTSLVSQSTSIWFRITIGQYGLDRLGKPKHIYYAQSTSFRVLSSLHLQAEAIPTGFTGGLVQTFYTVRVWRLSKKNHVLAVVIMLIVLAQTACGTAWVIISLQLQTFQQLLGISGLTLSINALSTAADVIIAASLCFLLMQSKTGFKHSDTLINRLIVFSVNTGLATSICAVASLLIASPNSLLYAPFYFCIGRREPLFCSSNVALDEYSHHLTHSHRPPFSLSNLSVYSNSLLATLNARNQIRNGSNDTEHMMVSLSQASREQTALPTIPKAQRSQNIAIRIDTAKEFVTDRKIDQDESSDGMFQ
ncbi:hypothetical protein F5878DRAFT_658646 [Lentinula raphanica]|uniref:DUF6534 domain-containing protein n=1 Tax=Lentinula raphanica TaxID=153919 RepID=A0AA38PE73_9AGAR|nr:hypothetical protein F5878DRAFT_658646 [Lentinula raphanica]